MSQAHEKCGRLRYFTQQQTPGQPGQASQTQVPVSQQPQSQRQQQAPLQQPSAQAGAALGAAAEEKSVASKNMNTYIEKSPSRKWQTQIKTETLFERSAIERGTWSPLNPPDAVENAWRWRFESKVRHQNDGRAGNECGRDSGGKERLREWLIRPGLVALGQARGNPGIRRHAAARAGEAGDRIAVASG